MPFSEPDLAPLLDTLARSAAERDKEDGHAAAQKQALADAGLLGLSIPERFGGDELPWSRLLQVVRTVARDDSALAHLLAFHHLQVATLLIYGTQEQQARWLEPTVRLRQWWGNAVNPRDERLRAIASPEGYRLEGEKRYCSGTLGSACMTVSARDADGAIVLGVVATAQHGITVREDWDAIGQRQTDSGSHFDAVRLARADVLRAPDTPPSVRHTVRTCLGQLILVNLYAGLAEGALAEARSLMAEGGIPTDAAVRAPLLGRLGDGHVRAVTATVMADRAGAQFDVLWQAGEAVVPQHRAEAAVAIAEAKVVAHRASLHLGEALFDIGGARATRGALGLDRFWRNARTHTLHDPLDQKLAALGRWSLEGEFPPGFYQ
ncbi:acyl-CoA dehydrogenase family protein [Xylophilus sp.]|uniref:acyl-CoA dehydrogenase family protein n=1 Tax=Xylophilus sp. TaxID=2653893 RepID=UPI0013BCF2B9|nr:acyl-CoA dehydrogenase family protein [Xylophilus sp.]KAF1044546.1 MAG: Dibenzothiophene desulfurization enzyme C [Xylophilus sp.]